MIALFLFIIILRKRTVCWQYVSVYGRNKQGISKKKKRITKLTYLQVISAFYLLLSKSATFWSIYIKIIQQILIIVQQVAKKVLKNDHETKGKKLRRERKLLQT